MISVKKDFNDIPEVLRNAGESDAWKDISVINRLKELYHGKCAYCETKTEDLKIDHYRPKSKYTWLKNEWSNLLPICPECNKASDSKFIIKEKSNQKTEAKENWIDNQYLILEKSFLIHPEMDTVENYFYFDFFGNIYSNSEKGNECIKSFQLNRQTLIKDRFKSYSIFKERVTEILTSQKQDSTIFKDLYDSTLPNAEFSLFGQQIFYDFERFLLDKVIKDLNEQNIDPEIELRKDKLLNNYREFVAAKLNIDWVNTAKIGVVAFALKKFNGIEEVKLAGIPIYTQWIFFTGQNGFGKTSILKALSLGLIRTGLEYLNLDENTRSEVMFFQDRRFNRFIYGANNYTRTYFPSVAAYGAKRTDLSDKNIPATSESLFEKTNSLYDFETMYKEWRIFPKENKSKIDNFAELMKMVIPNLSKIDIDRETSKVIYFEKTETSEELTPVTFNQLAMGMRSILAMIADLVYRLTNSKFEFTISNGVTNIEGIVLIDEFDNHLHPKWQRMLVEKLTTLFPKVQFIVSTHSPIPLLGAPPERTVILNVNRTKEEGITVRRLEKLEKELKYLLPNQLLTSDIFGLDEIENVHLTDEEFDKVPIEDKYNDIEANKKMMQELKELAMNKELFPDDLFKNKNL